MSPDPPVTNATLPVSSIGRMLNQVARFDVGLAWREFSPLTTEIVRRGRRQPRYCDVASRSTTTSVAADVVTHSRRWGSSPTVAVLATVSPAT